MKTLHLSKHVKWNNLWPVISTNIGRIECMKHELGKQNQINMFSLAYYGLEFNGH